MTVVICWSDDYQVVVRIFIRLNKNNIIKPPDTKVACVDFITPPIFSLSNASTGMVPSISITANKVKLMVIISFMAISLESIVKKLWRKDINKKTSSVSGYFY